MSTQNAHTDAPKKARKPAAKKQADQSTQPVPSAAQVADDKPKKKRTPKTVDPVAEVAQVAQVAATATEPPAQAGDKPKKKRAPAAKKPADPKPDTSAAPAPPAAPTPKKPRKPAESKKKRQANTKPTSLNTSGIGIGPARVKTVLTNEALNPAEHLAKLALVVAENKPKKPKPTEANPDPAMPPQGPQTPITALEPSVLKVVREAEAAYEQSLRESYERKYLSDLAAKDATAKDKYLELRAKAKAAGDFDLHTFNLTFDKNFYAGYSNYVDNHDSYAVRYADKNGNALYADGKPVLDSNGKPSPPYYNQWTRAAALINKRCVRLSGNTRNILACFLDRIVEQLTRNGLHNCLQTGSHSLRLKHALAQTAGFKDRVPINAFVSTLQIYEQALDWIDEHTAYTERRAEFTTEPVFAAIENKHEFDGYVNGVCRGVRNNVALELSDADRERVLNVSISGEFKRFCSHVVHGVIMRVGAVILEYVNENKTKTVGCGTLTHVLKQIHNTCGINYETTSRDMNLRLEQFADWREKKRTERKAATNGTTVADEATSDQ